MRHARWFRHSPALPILLVLLAAPHLGAQRSLAPASPSGQTVTPVYEGWYRNADGSLSLSFGYYSRNTAEVVEVPIGADNSIAVTGAAAGSRATLPQTQPSTFAPRRHWGVFAVQVPADFGKKEVLWTLKVRGETFAIPGTLHTDWEIDALEGEASADNTPPVLVFGTDEGRGPLGVTSGPLRVAVGQPLQLSVAVRDDGKVATAASGAARSGPMVDVTWFKHQGPGAVTLAPATSRVGAAGATAIVMAHFAQPGSYVVRVRANDSPVGSAGHSQCCWTNGFIRVTVTP